MNSVCPTAGSTKIGLAILTVILAVILEAEARNFRPGRIPNGGVFDCANCHSSSGGGDNRNPFGQLVESTIGGTSADIAFWGQALASVDSDGDGFTNGQELGDPSGNWPGQSARPGATNPGDPASRPRPPVFSSTPVMSVAAGLAYSYQAVAAEPNGLGVIYGKASGPDWLAVSSNGLVSGTPPASGTFPVGVVVFVGGIQALSAMQSYTLEVTGGNNPPVITSAPVTTATIGRPYEYQMEVSDPDGHALTFVKFLGPAWLNVTSGGVVSGTPPAGSAGSSTVFIRVIDNGTPQQFVSQSYTLVVSEAAASFASWQSQNFLLPADHAIAGPEDDPDADGLPNLAEYALKTPPKEAGSTRLMSNHSFNGTGQLQFTETIRDDDPKLAIFWELAGVLPWSNPDSVAPVVTDPTSGDGWQTWTFTDPVNRNSVGARYGRLRFEILP